MPEGIIKEFIGCCKVFFIFTLFIVVLSCAATHIALPEKYNLDNDLEAVDQISTFKVSSWEQDNFSPHDNS